MLRRLRYCLIGIILCCLWSCSVPFSLGMVEQEQIKQATLLKVNYISWEGGREEFEWYEDTASCSLSECLRNVSRGGYEGEELFQHILRALGKKENDKREEPIFYVRVRREGSKFHEITHSDWFEIKEKDFKKKNKSLNYQIDLSTDTLSFFLEKTQLINVDLKVDLKKERKETSLFFEDFYAIDEGENNPQYDNVYEMLPLLRCYSNQYEKVLQGKNLYNAIVKELGFNDNKHSLCIQFSNTRTMKVEEEGILITEDDFKQKSKHLFHNPFFETLHTLCFYVKEKEQDISFDVGDQNNGDDDEKSFHDSNHEMDNASFGTQNNLDTEDVIETNNEDDDSSYDRSFILFKDKSTSRKGAFFFYPKSEYLLYTLKRFLTSLWFKEDVSSTHRISIMEKDVIKKDIFSDLKGQGPCKLMFVLKDDEEKLVRVVIEEGALEGCDPYSEASLDCLFNPLPCGEDRFYFSLEALSKADIFLYDFYGGVVDGCFDLRMCIDPHTPISYKEVLDQFKERNLFDSFIRQAKRDIKLPNSAFELELLHVKASKTYYVAHISNKGEVRWSKEINQNELLKLSLAINDYNLRDNLRLRLVYKKGKERPITVVGNSNPSLKPLVLASILTFPDEKLPQKMSLRELSSRLIYKEGSGKKELEEYLFFELDKATLFDFFKEGNGPLSRRSYRYIACEKNNQCIAKAYINRNHRDFLEREVDAQLDQKIAIKYTNDLLDIKLVLGVEELPWVYLENGALQYEKKYIKKEASPVSSNENLSQVATCEQVMKGVCKNDVLVEEKLWAQMRTLNRVTTAPSKDWCRCVHLKHFDDSQQDRVFFWEEKTKHWLPLKPYNGDIDLYFYDVCLKLKNRSNRSISLELKDLKGQEVVSAKKIDNLKVHRADEETQSLKEVMASLFYTKDGHKLNLDTWVREQIRTIYPISFVWAMPDFYCFEFEVKRKKDKNSVQSKVLGYMYTDGTYSLCQDSKDELYYATDTWQLTLRWAPGCGFWAIFYSLRAFSVKGFFQWAWIFCLWYLFSRLPKGHWGSPSDAYRYYEI